MLSCGILLRLDIRVVFPDRWLCKETVDATEFQACNRVMCFDLSGRHQANTCDMRHKREIQIALLFGN